MSDKDNKDTQEVTLAEELTNLFEGAEVTDELKEKIGTIFEAVVASKVQDKEAELQESYETKLDELIQEAKIWLCTDIGNAFNTDKVVWLRQA